MTKTPPKIDFESLEQKINDPAPIDNPVPPPNGNGHVIEAPPVPRIGKEAAENMTKLSEAAATDIRKLGELAANAGAAVANECEQLANDLLASGRTVAAHLTGLSQLLADIGCSNRETHTKLIGGRMKTSETQVAAE